MFFSRGTEHVREKTRAQEGVWHDLLDDGEGAGLARREQRPVPDEVSCFVTALQQQMLDQDLPIAADLDGDRAAVGQPRQV